MQKPTRTIVSAAVVAMMASSVTYAGAFSLYTEGTVTALGNYAAGIAAEAADASTGWYNPAGLALLHNVQAVAGGAGVFPKSKLTGSSTFRTLSGLPAAFSTYTQNYDGIDGAKSAFVPSFHFAKPLSDNYTAGLSVVSPFGLSTEWNRFSPFRYAATYSELLTTDISPELGGRVTDNFLLGLGLDLQFARVKFNSVLGAPTVARFFGRAPTFFDSPSYNKGTSFAVGFHAGGMLLFNDKHTRIGLNYQSKMDHKFHGYSRLTGRFAGPGTTVPGLLGIPGGNRFRSYDLYSNDIEFPEIVTLSGYHDLNDSFALLGSIVYTGWHTLRSIQLNNVAAFVSGLGPRLVNSTSEQNYDNVWRFAIGANYKFDEQWMLRVGGGYDQTPTNDIDRDVRLPDADRWALSIGGHYQWRPDIGFDLGYTHLFSTGDVPINRTQLLATNTFTVNARASASADLVGLQAVWTMDPVMPMPTK